MNEVADALARDMTEAQLLAHVRNAAKKLGWICYHTHRSDRSEKGFPDCVISKNGVLIFAELKVEDRKKGKLDIDQLIWGGYLTRVEELNRTVYVFVCRPSDWLSGHIKDLLS
jgi:hypothetical protein